MPIFDPTKPAASSPIVSAELRDQFNALHDEFTDLQTSVTQVFSNANSVDPLDTVFHNPPTTADLEAIRAKLNELIEKLYN